MLDITTKRRIDSCRDILVGKLPDPKSQVEQITIALIYKFMDDMDAQSEEFGGKRSFFVGGFEKFGWSKLLSPGMGGQDTLNLYSEAISKMTENTHLPALFRDIFKNAYLPYRDPETLKSFLKEIDNFSYDNSERLGDAFEYLLSVLGSQGDAGQFRTPRHIIDFIVRVINPQKHERVLDPACGTAGFLISAWKYILEQNQKVSPGDSLTPGERSKLAASIHGYDISPDMVRLSLVNLYLHGFTNPCVDEYDTLTSEDKWSEHADIILANPPFMSPKGGIKPHKRFSIKATRSEVLFVDYIHEHLSPNGRAGIIVPEGIVFQNGGAYKSLRKILVQNSLVAVVSLPAGVFQPYSNVKTSILILDKRLAKQTDAVLFVKVNNDGFALGSQRRSLEQNDLPRAELALKAFYTDPAGVETDEIAQVVSKLEIAKSEDWNLNGDRYRSVSQRESHFPLVPIGSVCQLLNGRAFKSEEWETQEGGGLPIVRIQNLNNPNASFNYFSGVVVERNTIEHQELLFSWSGSRGTSFGAHIWRGEKAALNQHIFKVVFDKKKVLKEYLLYALNKAVDTVEQNLHGGVGLVHITKSNLEKILIPLPPIDIQRNIVMRIKDYEKRIEDLKEEITVRQNDISAVIEQLWHLPEIPQGQDE